MRNLSKIGLKKKKKSKMDFQSPFNLHTMFKVMLKLPLKHLHL